MLRQRVIKALGYIMLSLFIMSVSIAFTINFTPLYMFDIDYLNITDYVNISKEQIILNYRILLDYLNIPWITDLAMPDFPSSERGLFHFYEVKRLFMFNYLILAAAGSGTYFFMRYIKSRNLYKSLLIYFKNGIFLSLTVIVGILISFDSLFLLFHQSFFNNDAWLFNPTTDPIILVLPAEFFMHSFLLAFGLVEILLITGYVLTKRKTRDISLLSKKKEVGKQVGFEKEISTKIN